MTIHNTSALLAAQVRERRLRQAEIDEVRSRLSDCPACGAGEPFLLVGRPCLTAVCAGLGCDHSVAAPTLAEVERAWNESKGESNDG